ncbi:CxC ATPase DNA modification system associated small protein [Streptomyces anulatus]|uniref:CxC ATPase DNA modification system associated small protein n=1 Tax=Streptomyces anulatus TaxID=1892 RepID=UPI0036644128
MSLDKKISQAIEESVAEAGQEPALAHRLVLWMEAVTSGEDPGDPSIADRRLDLLYGITQTNEGSEAIF